MKYYIRANISNPEKILSLLYDVNNQVFDEFLNNDENIINIQDIELIVTSIISLINYDKDMLKNIMPYFLNTNSISNHSLHVSIYSIKLAILIGLSKTKVRIVAIAAILHNLGYKKIKEELLNKKDNYTNEDTKEIQKHVRYSVEILKHNGINDPNILNAVMGHHERYDGTGYPHSLRKDDISDIASIIAICDVFDALTNQRPHRKQLSSFEALKMMMKDSNMINKFNQSYLSLALKSLF